MNLMMSNAKTSSFIIENMLQYICSEEAFYLADIKKNR